MAITITSLTAYLGFDATESTVVDTGGNYVVGFIMPNTWTPAPVTVLVSTDNVTYHDLFVRTPERTSPMEFVFNYAPGAAVAINPTRMLMARYIRLRSGTREAPVPQAQTCSFTVITADLGGGGGTLPAALGTE